MFNICFSEKKTGITFALVNHESEPERFSWCTTETNDALKEEFVFVSVPTQPQDEKCGHAQNFQTQSVGELVLVSAWWCAWDGGWVRRRSRRHQLSAAVFTCTRDLVVWCSGGVNACTSGRTRLVSSVPLPTACGLFAGICQWNCDQKVKQWPKPSGQNGDNASVQFDQRDQAQWATIIRRQVVKNMTDDCNLPLAVQDLWQQFNYKE